MVGLRRMDEKGEIFDQINTGTVSKATPRKLQRDGVVHLHYWRAYGHSFPCSMCFHVIDMFSVILSQVGYLTIGCIEAQLTAGPPTSPVGVKMVPCPWCLTELGYDRNKCLHCFSQWVSTLSESRNCKDICFVSCMAMWTVGTKALQQMLFLAAFTVRMVSDVCIQWFETEWSLEHLRGNSKQKELTELNWCHAYKGELWFADEMWVKSK